MVSIVILTFQKYKNSVIYTHYKANSPVLDSEDHGGTLTASGCLRSGWEKCGAAVARAGGREVGRLSRVPTGLRTYWLRGCRGGHPQALGRGVARYRREMELGNRGDGGVDGL